MTRATALVTWHRHTAVLRLASILHCTLSLLQHSAGRPSPGHALLLRGTCSTNGAGACEPPKQALV